MNTDLCIKTGIWHTVHIISDVQSPNSVSTATTNDLAIYTKVVISVIAVFASFRQKNTWELSEHLARESATVVALQSFYRYLATEGIKQTAGTIL